MCRKTDTPKRSMSAERQEYIVAATERVEVIHRLEFINLQRQILVLYVIHML